MHSSLPFKAPWIFVFILMSMQSLYGHDRRFAFSEQSTVLPAQASELEVWNTLSFSRDYFYRRLDTRLEFEYGLGSNLSTALYLNHEAAAFNSAPGASEGTKATDIAVSVSNEWKYKISDPAADPVGFALYGEATVGIDESELEAKLIFDKQIGSNIAACTIILEHEWETDIANGITQATTEWDPSITAGFTHFFTPAFAVGFEANAVSVVEDGSLTHASLFACPVVSYADEHIWATLAFLPQFSNLKGQGGSLDLTEYERYQVRLLFSVSY